MITKDDPHDDEQDYTLTGAGTFWITITPDVVLHLVIGDETMQVTARINAFADHDSPLTDWHHFSVNFMEYTQAAADLQREIEEETDG